MPDNTYHICRACGCLVYRKHHYRYGDGQVDSDNNPIYLFSCDVRWPSFKRRLSVLRERDEVTEIDDCGCLQE